MQKLIVTLDEIINLLVQCNQDVQVAWLKKKSDALIEPGKLSEKEILLEIRRSIAGMGSLSDIYLMPSQTSGLSESQANRRLHELIKELDKEIHRLINQED